MQLLITLPIKLSIKLGKMEGGQQLLQESVHWLQHQLASFPVLELQVRITGKEAIGTNHVKLTTVTTRDLHELINGYMPSILCSKSRVPMAPMACRTLFISPVFTFMQLPKPSCPPFCTTCSCFLLGFQVTRQKVMHSFSIRHSIGKDEDTRQVNFRSTL